MFGANFTNQNITELHALWDSVVTSFDRDVIPPFTKEDWVFMSESASSIMRENPLSSFTEEELRAPVEEWVKESYGLATKFVYRMGIEENGIPSEEYVREGTKIAWRQIAKGGFRLARLLERILTQ